MEQYQVSRDTVRKALSLLQEEGLIKKDTGARFSSRQRRNRQFPCIQPNQLPRTSSRTWTAL